MENAGDWTVQAERKQRLAEGRKAKDEMDEKDEPRVKLLEFHDRREPILLGPGSPLSRIKY